MLIYTICKLRDQHIENQNGHIFLSIFIQIIYVTFSLKHSNLNNKKTEKTNKKQYFSPLINVFLK